MDKIPLPLNSLLLHSFKAIASPSPTTSSSEYPTNNLSYTARGNTTTFKYPQEHLPGILQLKLRLASLPEVPRPHQLKKEQRTRLHHQEACLDNRTKKAQGEWQENMERVQIELEDWV
jgi:hypothetical protein